jgi:hypothetical protein
MAMETTSPSQLSGIAPIPLRASRTSRARARNCAAVGVSASLRQTAWCFYVGNLSTFPLVNGSTTIFHVTPSGRIPETMGHLTSVLGLAFDHEGRMYALENTVCPSAAPCMPTPFTGRVVRVASDGSLETIASGLLLPTGMTIGPDEAIYVSVLGFGGPPGGGSIVRIAF